MSSRLYVHVPTPGDHYSSATGSATMTVIYELSREHERHGGRTKVVVGGGTRHDYAVGECTEVGFRGLPGRREKLVDAALGSLGLERRFAAATYEPALAAVEPEFDGPLLIHNNAGPLPMLARRRPHSQRVLYAHNDLFRTYTRRELRRTLGAADVIVCVSEFLAGGLVGRLAEAARRLAVVRNGVDVDRFAPAARPADGDPVVLFVGRVIPEKGADILLRAAEKLRAPHRRFRVRIVGSSGFSARDPLSRYERHLRDLARPLGSAVEFQPFVDRAGIVDEYRRASIFCAPSNWDEPVSLTVPEALACGLPTIAARRGGIPEVGGDAALYFNPPDADALAAQLAYLLDDESARAEWGRRARARSIDLAWSFQYQRLRRALER